MDENIVASEMMVLDGEKNWQVIPIDRDFVSELGTAETSFFTSLPNETEDDKAKLFNVMNNPDARISAMVGKVILLTHFFMETVNLKNDETGEMGKAPRVVLVDKDGQSFQAVSTGIFNALKKIVGMYGMGPWSPPIPVEIAQIDRGTKNRIFTLKIMTGRK